MLKALSYILCDLDPKVRVIGQKAGICDGVPSTSALVTFAARFIQASLCKFKDFSRTFKRLSYCFQGLKTYKNTDLHINLKYYF